VGVGAFARDEGAESFVVVHVEVVFELKAKAGQSLEAVFDTRAEDGAAEVGGAEKSRAAFVRPAVAGESVDVGLFGHKHAHAAADVPGPLDGEILSDQLPVDVGEVVAGENTDEDGAVAEVAAEAGAYEATLSGDVSNGDPGGSDRVEGSADSDRGFAIAAGERLSGGGSAACGQDGDKSGCG
jgi:hypothetical protein